MRIQIRSANYIAPDCDKKYDDMKTVLLVSLLMEREETSIPINA
jgi:hypothetical protein